MLVKGAIGDISNQAIKIHGFNMFPPKFSLPQNKHEEAGWRIYASVSSTIIGSQNGLSSVRRQPIVWTNDGLL